MANRMLLSAVAQLRQALHPEHAPGVADSELLGRFLRYRDEAAFELLVWRHGPMVLDLCQRVLAHQHDAEDAFQATFLTLAVKAADIDQRQAVGSWLYKVAYRVALRAKARARRRGALEQPLPAEPSYEPADELAWRELRPVIDAEVDRLPEKYRAAFVLCCLQGKTNEEAAAELGCPKGTVLSRLARARERLRGRLSLARLGVAVERLGDLLSKNASTVATMSPVLVHGAVCMAVLAAAGSALHAAAPAPVAALAEGAARAERAGRPFAVAGLLAVIVVAALSAAVSAFGGSPWSAFTGGSTPSDHCNGAVQTAPLAAPGQTGQ
ncbi:MAG: RNA polymerase sigma factor [Gemmataceae bacterium]|nr:RNA polymerase sigma factor [Gemmataceae bacterium]